MVKARDASSRLRIGVASECGEEFRAALTQRLEGVPVLIGPIDGTDLDVAVVGGWNVEDDLNHALAGGAQWIQTLTAGVDRVMTQPVVDSGVRITNGASATARPVSEFAMARILEHMKRLEALRTQQTERTWAPRFLPALAGATVTVVGLGPVGSRVARLAEAFEMHVIGVRRNPARLSPHCAEVLGPDALAEAFARSDVAVLAPALTPDTRGMVGSSELAAAKPGMLLVNVGRGELIDHDSLIDAVTSGAVFAALDVAPEEPLPVSHPLWATPGIALSSHTAALTPPLVGWLADVVAANVGRFIAGEALHDQVDVNRGYPLRESDEPSATTNREIRA